MTDRRWTLLGLAAVLAMGLGLRIHYQGEYLERSAHLHAPAGEARVHHELAEQVAAGHVGGPQFLPHNPAYPLLLGALYRGVGKQTRYLAVFQAALGLLILLLVYLLGARVASPPVGVLAAALTALYGPLLFYETKQLPDTLATLALLATVLLGLWAPTRARARWAIATGVACGALAWIRPGLLLLPLALGLVALPRLVRAGAQDRRRWLARAGWALVGLALVATPLALRNAANGAPGRLLAAHRGVDFYAANNPTATGVPQPPPGFVGPRDARHDEARRLAAKQLREASPSDDRVSRHFWGLGLRWVASDPGGGAKLLARKAYRFAMAHEPADAYSFGGERASIPALRWAPVPFSLLLFFGLGGLILLAGRDRRWLGCAVAVHLLLALVFHVSGSGRVTLAPLLAVSAAAALWTLLRRLPASVSAWGLLVGGLSLAALMLVNPLDEPRRLQSAHWLAQGQALVRQGRPHAAREAFGRALGADPNDYLARVLHGNTYVMLGRPRRALPDYRHAIRLQPRRPLARLAFARAALPLSERARARGDRGLWSDWLHQALTHVQLAQRADPDDVDGLLLHARLLRYIGNLDQARASLDRALRLAPARGDVHAERGVIAVRQGQPALARSHFHAARLLGHPVDTTWEQQAREGHRSRTPTR